MVLDLRLSAALLVACLALAGCAAPAVEPTPAPPTGRAPTATPPEAPASALRLEPALDGFSRPLLLTHDGTGALYVAEQDGRIWRIERGERALWLDIDEQVGSSGNEQGLLGLAFEPGTRRAYVSYTDNGGDSILSRLHEDGREEVILRVDQPYSNHNGGHVAFGPDGHLYYGLGDGGSANDPQGNGQDPDALLGSLLRLDVSGESGYEAPPDNRYAEVWAKGLRNPWRFTFDRATGDLYIADVGQGAREEINYVRAGTPGGLNFGWPAYEGTQRRELRAAFSPVTPPVHEYPLRVEGRCAVIGGHVYRGAAEPGLQGAYLFGDHCSGEIWGLRFEEGEWRAALLLASGLNITSFGEDAEGEMY
ncbi:MAG TPA: PQQ-dependent sugar dehydrogenase, partial [Candidatus Thermoplasmatota archaeon]|nr:PQQ-dependent sugar dehydrogenase [Candidatus Thermoplasmatota archaeon]